MADANSTPDASSTSTPKKKTGLITFIKKNKTLSAVIGGIGGYLLYKMSKEKSPGGTETEPEGEVNAIAGEGGAAAGTAEAAAFELGRAERVAESSHSEVEEIEAEREEERLKRKEEKQAQEEVEEATRPESEPNPTSPTAPSGGEEVPVTGPASPSVNIHGRNFPGATGSHIAKSGKTNGGKAYVEYAIQFPGKVEHWQYFTGTGNWRQVAGSNTGGGANKPGPGNNPKPNGPPAGGTGSGPKSGGPPKSKPKLGTGIPLPPKPKPAPQPAPPRAPQCAPGTVGNILHARAEVNRLQSEINSLQASRPRGWAANVASKQATRDQFQQVIANGHAQPGCANV